MVKKKQIIAHPQARCSVSGDGVTDNERLTTCLLQHPNPFCGIKQTTIRF